MIALVYLENIMKMAHLFISLFMLTWPKISMHPLVIKRWFLFRLLDILIAANRCNDRNKWVVRVLDTALHLPVYFTNFALPWRHNKRDGVSNHRRLDRLLNRLFRRRSKKTPKLRVAGLCAGNSQVTGEFPAQRASNADIVSNWWRHHDQVLCTKPSPFSGLLLPYKSDQILCYI